MSIVAVGSTRTSQRVARSTSRRPSISISSCIPPAIWLSSASTSLPELRMSNTSRATAYARARVGGRGAGLLAQPERERGPGTVDELVGDDRGDDLPPQPVAVHLLPIALRERSGK